MCVCACVCVYVCMFACTCINVISNVIFASPPPPSSQIWLRHCDTLTPKLDVKFCCGYKRTPWCFSIVLYVVSV